MNLRTDKLISVASSAHSLETPLLAGEIGSLAGELRDGLESLLARKNGFFAFEGALHVFSSVDVDYIPGLSHWNNRSLWKFEYGNLIVDCLCFAEDVFGDQFCIYKGSVWKIDSETGDMEYFAQDIEEWSDKLLSDYSVHLGYGLAYQWQKRFAPIPDSDRLLPKKPFVLGGDFIVENLYNIDRVKGMRFRGYLAQQIRDIPDKSKIQIKFS